MVLTLSAAMLFCFYSTDMVQLTISVSALCGSFGGKSMDNLETNTSNSTGTKTSLIKRIWRYKFCYLISIPGILFIILMKFLPVIMGIRLSFIAYKPAQGIFNSPWVGMENFKSIISQPYLPRIIKNSIMLNAGFVLMCSCLAFIIVWGLSRIPSRAATVFTTIFLIPLFIPSVVLCCWIYAKFSNSLSNSYYVRFIYMCAQTIKYSGIPIILGVASVNSCKSQSVNEAGKYVKLSAGAFIKPLLRVILAFSIIQMSLIFTNDFEMVLTMYNSKTYTTMDIFDTYNYRTGLVQFGYSKSATMWLIRFIVQIITATFAYLLLRRLFKNDLFHQKEVRSVNYESVRKGTNLAGLIPVVLYSGFILFILYMILIYPFTLRNSQYLSLSTVMGIIPKNAFPRHFLASMAGALLSAIFTVTLAYPLTAQKLPGRSLIKAVLIATVSIGSYSISEYLYYRSLGMADPNLAFVISGSFSIAGIFVLKSIFNSKYANEKEDRASLGKSEGNMFFTLFLPRIWKPLTALTILQFSSLWGSFYTSLIFTGKREFFTPILIFNELIHAINLKLPSGGLLLNPAVLQLGAVITIVPVALFLIFRPFFTSETFVGQLRK